MADFKKIKSAYIRGGVSLRELSEKYGVSFSTLQKYAAKEKWTDLRKISGIKRDEKIAESVAEREAAKVDKIQTCADLLLDKIVKGLENDELVVTGRSLRDISGALRDIRDIKGIKTDLDIKEQEARIEKLRKDAQVEQIDKEITVVMISDDPSEYAD